MANSDEKAKEEALAAMKKMKEKERKANAEAEKLKAEADAKVVHVDKKGWWSKFRWTPCVWMMKVTNLDMLQSAYNRDAIMLENCIDCGGWIDNYTHPDDLIKNTVFHLVVQYCQDLENYLAEAERLSLTLVELEHPTRDWTPQEKLEGRNFITWDKEPSSLKPTTKKAQIQLQKAVDIFDFEYNNDIKMVKLCIQAGADPLLENSVGLCPLCTLLLRYLVV